MLVSGVLGHWSVFHSLCNIIFSFGTFTTGVSAVLAAQWTRFSVFVAVLRETLVFVGNILIDMIWLDVCTVKCKNMYLIKEL